MDIYEFKNNCNNDEIVWSVFNCATEDIVDIDEHPEYEFCEVMSFDINVEDGIIHIELNIDEEEFEDYE